jgi:hypothetical protein
MIGNIRQNCVEIIQYFMDLGAIVDESNYDVSPIVTRGRK